MDDDGALFLVYIGVEHRGGEQEEY